MELPEEQVRMGLLRGRDTDRVPESSRPEARPVGDS